MSTPEKPPTNRPAIPHDPLPQAGDSLYDQLLDQVFGKAVLWGTIILVGAVFAGLEWYRYLLHVPSTREGSIGVTVLAVILGVVGFFKIRRAMREADVLRAGIRGEKHVSQYLNETCRMLGYRVFDDVKARGSGGDFNIDHVLIGPGGIFSIETKNWTLPPKGTTAFIQYDPKLGRLTKPDGSWEEKPVAQARNNAEFLRELLAKRTARAASVLWVRPVLMLPGWYVKDPSPRPRALWILGNNTLHQWLEDEPCRLTEQDVALFAEALACYVRSYGK